ncbi:efflux RND transporter periplasmic adaptor subunit [Paludisphaera soli]|uniref:efflux RND transporter periplasmic adaptor subunit n=1 Tax=Paludisphaera soli TaxID=2712865 RepID=UPI0013EA8623|nr:efflux RND transporter periplasmic adaptor subunit [Paludisphaera soli]
MTWSSRGRLAARTTLLVIVCGAGCTRSPESASNPAPTAPGGVPIVTVATVAPQRGPIRKMTREPGQIEAYEATSLHARVGGYIRSIAVDAGDPVKAGQVIAEIDVPELDAAADQKRALLEQAEAGRKQADAAVVVAQAAVSTAEARIAEARASIRRTDADAARWQAEYERTSRLVREGAVTGSVLDEAQSKLESARATRDEATALVQSAEAAQAQAQAELVQARADVPAAAARVDVARADLEAAEAMAGFGKILAPFDGVVTRRHVHPGHLTMPGGAGTPLLEVERIDRLRVAVGVPEVDATFVQPGDPAEVRVQALDGRTVKGAVSRISWSLDRATRTLRTEIDLDNPDGTLRPGLYAYVAIVAEERPDALTLPTTAIVKEGGETFCVLVEAGTASRRKLRLGLTGGGLVEILDGLEGGETVVAAEAASLADGQPVAPSKATPK